MPSDDRVPVPGHPDPKPFKLIRVDLEGRQISRLAELATEHEAKSFKRRLDWRYALYHGRKKISD